MNANSGKWDELPMTLWSMPVTFNTLSHRQTNIGLVMHREDVINSRFDFHRRLLSCVDWINLRRVSVCVDTEMNRQFVTNSGIHPLLKANPLGLPEGQSISKIYFLRK